MYRQHSLLLRLAILFFVVVFVWVGGAGRAAWGAWDCFGYCPHSVTVE